MSDRPDIDRRADATYAEAARDRLEARVAEWEIAYSDMATDRDAQRARVAELEAALRKIEQADTVRNARELAKWALAGDGGGAPLARDSEANPFAWFGGDGGGA